MALRTDQDFKTAERATALWRSPEMAHEKTLSLLLPFLHMFTRRSYHAAMCLPALSHHAAMRLSLGVLFLWKLEIIAPKVNASPIYCQSHHCFHFNVPGLQLSTGLLQGKPHFPLIYNFHNTAGCILEKNMRTCFAWGLSPENVRYGASLRHCSRHLYL